MTMQVGGSGAPQLLERAAPTESESAAQAVNRALRRRAAGTRGAGGWFFLGALLVQLAVVATFNILVNPYRLYHSRWVPPVIQDDYTAKMELLQRCQPRLLVLGSSRVRKLEPAYLQRRTGLPAFNMGVASSLPEDWICLFRYATEGRGRDVKWVVLGVDVDSFHPTAPVNPPLLKNPGLRVYLPPALRPGWSMTLADLAQALTLEQSEMSIRALWPHPRRSREWFDPDGLVHVDGEDRPLDLSQDMRPCMQRFQDYPHLSPARLGYLDELARRCRTRGIRLSVFLTTVHDQYARAVAATYEPRYRELVPRLREMAARDQFRFVDCSRVWRYGGDPNDFYDSSHIKSGNARRIIDHVIQ
jgi:hypothetical protein